jgi:hypothetical protein
VNVGRTAARSRGSQLGEDVAQVLRGRTLRTAGPIAALVGTLLSAVNQGAVIVSGHIGAVTWARIAVNYLVPFLVASAGYLSARRRLAPPPDRPDREGRPPA